MKIIALFLFVSSLSYSQNYFNRITTYNEPIAVIASKTKDNKKPLVQQAEDFDSKKSSHQSMILEYQRLKKLYASQIKSDTVFNRKIYYLSNFIKNYKSENSIRIYEKIDSLNKKRSKYLSMYDQNMAFLKRNTLNQILRTNQQNIRSINHLFNSYTDSIRTMLSANQDYAELELQLIREKKKEDDEKISLQIQDVESRIEKLKDSMYTYILLSDTSKNESFLVDYQNPIKGNIFITSPFGERIHPISNKKHVHNGIDIRANKVAVFSILPGKVRQVKYDKKLGIFIEIIHSNGLVSIYGHLSKINVLPGDVIDQKKPIGKTGNTGHTTGPHLHFIVKKNNKAIDPAKILKL